MPNTPIACGDLLYDSSGDEWIVESINDRTMSIRQATSEYGDYRRDVIWKAMLTSKARGWKYVTAVEKRKQEHEEIRKLRAAVWDDAIALRLLALVRKNRLAALLYGEK